MLQEKNDNQLLIESVPKLFYVKNNYSLDAATQPSLKFIKVQTKRKEAIVKRLFGKGFDQVGTLRADFHNIYYLIPEELMSEGKHLIKFFNGADAYIFDVISQYSNDERLENSSEFKIYEQGEQVESRSQKESNSSGTQPHSTKAQKQQNARRDKRCKNLPQNIGSFCRTIVPKILSRSSKTKGKQIKMRMTDFFDQHKANNNQLIIMFTYFFMIQEEANPDQFLQFRYELELYLNKRINESQYFDKEERETYLRRININRTLAQKYFDGNSIEIDTEWIKIVCTDMFTGRQKNTINKPLQELEKIQNSLTGSKNEFLNNSSSHIETLSETITRE